MLCDVKGLFLTKWKYILLFNSFNLTFYVSHRSYYGDLLNFSSVTSQMQFGLEIIKRQKNCWTDVFSINLLILIFSIMLLFFFNLKIPNVEFILVGILLLEHKSFNLDFCGIKITFDRLNYLFLMKLC